MRLELLLMIGYMLHCVEDLRLQTCNANPLQVCKLTLRHKLASLILFSTSFWDIICVLLNVCIWHQFFWLSGIRRAGRIGGHHLGVGDAAALTCSNHGSSSPSSIYSPGSHGCLLLKTCEGDCQPFAQKKHTWHSMSAFPVNLDFPI